MNQQPQNPYQEITHQSGQNQNLPPMGWYPDPGGSSDERYWDGRQWTRNVRPASSQPQLLSEPVRGQMGDLAGANLGEQPLDNPRVPARDSMRANQPPVEYFESSYVTVKDVPVTKAGVELAGWWRRVAATLFDLVIVSAISAIAGFSLMQKLFGEYSRFVNDYYREYQTKGAAAEMPDLELYDIVSPTMYLMLIQLGVGFVYTVLMLWWKAASVGQLICRMRVVDATTGEVTEGLSLSQAGIRSLSYQVFVGLGNVTVLLVPIINVCWALFDLKRQCLHDKIAKTQVVKL